MSFQFEKFLCEEITALLSPLINADAVTIRRLFANLGWDIDALSGFDIDAVITVTKTLGQILEELDLEDSGEVIEVAQRITAVQNEINRIYLSIQKWVPPVSLPSETPVLLIEDLFHGLFDAYLVRSHPFFHGIFLVTGLLESEIGSQIKIGSRIIRQQRFRPRFKLNRISDVIRDPLGYVNKKFQDSSNTDPDGFSEIIFPYLASLLNDLGFDAQFGELVRPTSTNATVEEFDAAQRLLIINFYIPFDIEGTRTYSLQRIILAIAPASDGSGPALLVATSGNAEFNVKNSFADINFSFNQLLNSILIGRNGINLLNSTDQELLPNFRFGFCKFSEYTVTA